METAKEIPTAKNYQHLDAEGAAASEGKANARYAVEVRGSCLHAEADDLIQLVQMLDGLAGKAHVIDRVTRTLVYEGTVSEVFKAITGHGGRV